MNKNSSSDSIIFTPSLQLGSSNPDILTLSNNNSLEILETSSKSLGQNQNSRMTESNDQDKKNAPREEIIIDTPLKISVNPDQQNDGIRLDDSDEVKKELNYSKAQGIEVIDLEDLDEENLDPEQPVFENLEDDDDDLMICDPNEIEKDSFMPTSRRAKNSKVSAMDLQHIKISKNIGSWPKYLGSFDYKIFLLNRDYRTINFARGKFSLIANDFNPSLEHAQKFNNFFRASDVCILINYENKHLGYLECMNNEMFAFLLKKNFIQLDCHYLGHVSESDIIVQIDIFLTNTSENNPLQTKSKKRLTKKKGRKKKVEESIELESEEDSSGGDEVAVVQPNEELLAQEINNIENLTAQSLYLLLDIVSCPIIEDCFAKGKSKEDYEKFIESKYGTIFYPCKDLVIQYHLEGFVKHNYILLAGKKLEKRLELERKAFNLQDSNDFSPAQSPHAMKTQLYEYQAQALQWMLFREKCISENQLYKSIENSILDACTQIRQFCDGDIFYYNIFNGRCTLSRPVDICRGGIVSDDMGLGKTVMMIALIASNPYQIPLRPKNEEKKSKKKDSNSKVKVNLKKVKQNENQNFPESMIPNQESSLETEKLDQDLEAIAKLHEKEVLAEQTLSVNHSKKAGTLIILPKSLISQWEKEIFIHSEGSLDVYPYYDRKKDLSTIPYFHVVLTTYDTILAENTKPHGLKDFHWFRIVLDEAHEVKNHKSKTSRAICELNAENRWCLSGTPIQNNYDDLHSLLKFLRYEPWSETYIWKSHIDDSKGKEKIVRAIVRPILLRRSKESTYNDGKNIVSLPEKNIRTEFVELFRQEREVYDFVYNQSVADLTEMMKIGSKLNYTHQHVFQMIMKLRQICDHLAIGFKKEDLGPNLERAVRQYLMNVEMKPKNCKKKTNDLTNFQKDVFKKLAENSVGDCPICFLPMKNCAFYKCLHLHCSECMKTLLATNNTCSICRLALVKKDMFFTEDYEQDSLDLENLSDFLDLDDPNFQNSSKVECVMRNLVEIKNKNEKVVIFTQFIGMMNILGKAFNGFIDFVRIDGSTKSKDREKLIAKFKDEDSNITALLISMKSGCVGLNLTVAKHVFLIDPWWNPMIEDQAMDRVHRIGQLSDVTVTRFICKETVEQRISDLNDEKRTLTRNIFSVQTDTQKVKSNLEQLKLVLEKF